MADIRKVKLHPKLLLLFIVMLALAFVITYISNSLLLPNNYTSQNQQVVNSSLLSPNLLIKTLSFLSSILVAPIMESIIFQYGVQRNLAIKISTFTHSKIFTTLLSATITFAIFFLFHSPSLSLNDLIYYSFLLFFCLFYGLSNDNLLLTIIFHMGWNLL
ncbi:type II CAAX prenyl endopeptidase Rce1 family protein [Weissella minor]